MIIKNFSIISILQQIDKIIKSFATANIAQRERYHANTTQN